MPGHHGEGCSRYHAGKNELTTLQIVRLFHGKRSGNWKGRASYMARCPSHRDRSASLSITQDRDGATFLHCLASETRIITKRGIRSIGELAGKKATLLTSKSGVAAWQSCAIESFGKQRLYEIVVERSGTKKTIYATDGHRWFTESRKNKPIREVTTLALKQGTRLAQVFTKQSPANIIPFGVAHGFVFGDGTRTKNAGCTALFCGIKDQALLPYFPFIQPLVVGPGLLRIGGMPYFFKDAPALTESAGYLLGWMAGYFAADGCVGEDGHATIASASRENLQKFRDIGNIVGIGTYGIRCQMRKGCGDELTPLYQMSLRGCTLRSDFFILPSHRKRFEEMRHTKGQRDTWIVESVSPTDRVEEVYCAVVPGTHRFALEDNILTGNCFRGCTIDEIMGAKGLTLSDLFEAKREMTPAIRQQMRDDDRLKLLERRHGLAIMAQAVLPEERRYWAKVEQNIAVEIEGLRTRMFPIEAARIRRESETQRIIRVYGFDELWSVIP